MKRLPILLAPVAALLPACIGYVEPNRYCGERCMDRDHGARLDRVDRDRDRGRDQDRARDHDGVPDRQDRRQDELFDGDITVAPITIA